jgi:hypothetical protein
VLEAERTTPEAVELHAFFDKMVKMGCTHCVMEVSSHSLALSRTRWHSLSGWCLYKSFTRPLGFSWHNGKLFQGKENPF